MPRERARGVHRSETGKASPRDNEGQSGRAARPDLGISVDEAMRAITINAAYSWRMEKDLGSIEPNKIANFTVLDEDPYEVAPMHLKDIKLWGTVFEGDKFPIQH